MQSLDNVQMVFGKNWKHNLKLYLLLLLLLFQSHLHNLFMLSMQMTSPRSGSQLSKQLRNMLAMLWRLSISNKKMLQGIMKFKLQNVPNQWLIFLPRKIPLFQKRMNRLRHLRTNLPEYEQNQRQRGNNEALRTLRRGKETNRSLLNVRNIRAQLGDIMNLVQDQSLTMCEEKKVLMWNRKRLDVKTRMLN